MRAALHARMRARRLLSAPLRFATANAIAPYFSVGYGVTNNAQVPPTVKILQREPQVIGTDFTTLVPGFMNQYLSANVGVKNIGSATNFDALYVNYNGVTVACRVAGSASFSVADAANVFFDAMPSTLFGGATKFAKGTILEFRSGFSTTAPSTKKYPSTNARLSNQQNFYFDPRKVNITGDITGTGVLAYTMKALAITGATASGTLVTATVASTASLVTNTNYAIAGATGTGNQLNYNGTFTISVIDGVTIQYTATTAPSASATGSLTCTALNGTDANFGSMIPIFALGYHNSSVPIFIGDSKTFGTNDTTTTIGVQGMSRAMFTDPTTASTVLHPACNFGCPNGVANDPITVSGGSLANYQAWWGYGTDPIVGYGTNGFQTTQLQTLYTQLRAATGKQKIVQRSLTPRTSSTTDAYTTLGGQTLNASWGVGSLADTYEQTLRGWVSTDANFAYYQSTGERASATTGTTNYWLWFVNGTAQYATSTADGTHEGGVAPGYQLNVNTAGTITTQAGGTVSQSLVAYVAALP